MGNKYYEELDSQTRILNELASTFSQDSPEYLAIENAAFALIFAVTEQLENFTSFVHSSSEELSDDQKEYLQKLGIPSN